MSMSSPLSDLINSSATATAGNVYPTPTATAAAVITSHGVPKFKSLSPPSLPISHPPSSPNNYINTNNNNIFTIPPGLSPADLLDSPVLLSSSHTLPSPTTGTFPVPSFNLSRDAIINNTQQEEEEDIKQEQNDYSNFTFQSQIWPSTAIIPTEQTPWTYQVSTKGDGNAILKEIQPISSFSPEIGSGQPTSLTGFHSDYNQYNQPSQSTREKKRSEVGFSWRKYGQKQVKGSENPRSYYKCTYPNCKMRKIVETSTEGQITEIVYKGSHNHPVSQSNTRSSSSPVATPDQSYVSHGSGQGDSAVTPENSSISVVDDDFELSSQKRKPEFDEDEPDAKRWMGKTENEIISAPGSRTVREPRVVVQTISEIDILDDGYRWRKYGQKVVKGNPNPRSYYKCTNPGCLVTKQVERASHDLRAVITTYQGKHNHDIPAARGSGSHSFNRPMPSNAPMRPSATSNISNNTMIAPFYGLRTPMTEGLAPFTIETLQDPSSFGFSGYENSMSSYMNQSQHQDNGFSRTKDEPRDDVCLEPLLY